MPCTQPPIVLVSSPIERPQPHHHETTNHGRDPLPCVDRTVEDNGRLDSLAGTSPEVDACDGISVQRLPGRHDFRLRRILSP